MKYLVITLAACLMLSFTIPGFCQSSVPPGKEDKCPVCGMFVYKYPDWSCQVQFKDEIHYFDGVKDMFKFIFNLKQYVPGKSREDVTAIFVTEYYNLEPMPAERAWFVSGSDTYGPMGQELIPFAKKEDAETFLKDHKGKAILSFDQVTRQVIEMLNQR